MSLKITVSGATGTGKTTIAREIVERLKSGGFNVVNDDLDEILMPTDSDTQANRLCTLLDKNVEIVVDTKQAPRERSLPIEKMVK